MYAIEIEDLRKVFPGRRKQAVVAVDGLSLRVARGQVFGLLGPNGAGKTTTVEICEGLQRQTSGVVRVLGDEWTRRAMPRIRNRIGVSLQETRFIETQTVRETVGLFRSFFQQGRTVEASIDAVSLGEKADARVDKLSGGQQQRLAVACALVGDPELLFLDEPTTGLDPQSRRSLWDVVRAFRAGGGTVLLTTHYMDEAELLCDRVGIVDRGKLIAEGAPRELVRSLGGEHLVEVAGHGLSVHGQALTAGLTGVLRARVDGDRLSIHVAAPHLVVPALLARLTERGVELTELATRHTSLEDVFVALTGRHLRDDEGEAA
ncbi:MAG: ABC transporter ATP-binding protein [Planctomycetota bacterium]